MIGLLGLLTGNYIMFIMMLAIYMMGEAELRRAQTDDEKNAREDMHVPKLQ